MFGNSIANTSLFRTTAKGETVSMLILFQQAKITWFRLLLARDAIALLRSYVRTS